MRRGSTLWRLGTIAVVAIAAAIILYQIPLNLGLDLQGGVHIVLEAEADGKDIDEATMSRTLAVINRRVNALGVAEPTIQRQGERRIIVQLPGVTDQQRAIDIIGKTAQLEIKDPTGKTVLTGADLVNAQLGRDQFGRPAVDIEFSKESADKLAQITTNWQGQRIPHVLDGELLVNPTIQTPILDGRAQITGMGSSEEAKNLAVLLRAGALPVPMRPMEIRNVGPILGKASIDSSFKAGILGIILVLIYMIGYYKLPGIVADVALGIYVLIVLGLMAALHATLTLPGIAGFILSIGMAVDANVIIFERVKEELISGKRLRPAIDAGFGRAFRTIFDANVTTLIGAVVLFYFGTSAVKGFAVTLSLGILASMFTAIVVTRALLATVVDVDPDRFSKYFGVKGLVK